MRQNGSCWSFRATTPPKTRLAGPTDFANPATVSVSARRGAIGDTRWTRKNPPNFVERSLVLLGRTADTGRVWDIIAAAGYLRAQRGDKLPIVVAGKGPAGILAAYAALWDDKISGVIVQNPPASHMDSDAPQFLNVLRVCDIPDILGMIAPRPLTVYGGTEDLLKKTAAIYDAAGSPDQFRRKP